MSDQMFCPHCNPCMGNGNEKCRRPAAAPAAPFVPPMAQCWDCGGWYATTVGHKCAATTIAAAPAAPAPECMYRNGCQTPADCRASGRCFESNYPHKRAAPDAEHSTDGAESRRAGHAPTIGPSPSTYADDLVRLLHGASDGYSSVNLNGAAKMCHDAAALIGELRATVEQQARELDEEEAIRDKVCKLLARVVVAVRGPEPALTRWSYHDAPELVEQVVRDRDAARAAIAAADADAARYRFLRMSPTQLGWDADYRPDEVDAAIDAARAAMGDGNG